MMIVSVLLERVGGLGVIEHGVAGLGGGEIGNWKM